MAPLPSRKSLEAMKRVDLQRICKDYGVRANLKSEALIDLLLDTQSTPAPQPTRRLVSTRQSSRAGPSRVSSMIVHDISEDEAQEEEATHSEETKEGTPPEHPIIPPPRTRKAQELQTRLGVGKPLAAGGQGPRAVTRSSGSSKGKRAKSSKIMKPKEATIEEEPEIISIASKAPISHEVQQETRSPSRRPQDIPTFTSDDPAAINVTKMLENAMRPLQEQIYALKAEVDEVQTIKSDIANLQVQVADVCKAQKDVKAEFEHLRELSSIVLSLKEEIRQLREGLSANRPLSRPSTPLRSGQPKQGPIGFELLSTFKGLASAPLAAGSDSEGGSNSLPPHPGVAASTLGKRHRDSTASNVTGVVEEGQEDEYSDGELARKVVRPNKKRPRMQKDGDNGNAQRTTSRQALNLQDDDQEEASGSNDAMHAFTVFRGTDEPLDYIDPPPPTTRLPDFFHPESPPTSSSNLPRPKSTTGVPTSSANAAENQPQTFGFGFLPISSTPQNPMYMPSFPYPDPPQSPSPAGPSLGTFLGRQDDRTDIFKPFGFPSPVRSTRHYGALAQEDRGVNPAALTQGSSGKQREVSNNEGRTVSSSDAGSTLDPPLSKRTMYGTELDGDTRFGDFGLEGMATGYWASGKF